MCGFAGIVAWEDRYRFDRAVLGRMSARIAHRGPDGEGIWINHDGEVNPGRPQVGLAHRRLAIIDLDERANQPFTDGRGRWLAFNGEIYNYRELRRELEGLLPDYPWRTQSDTEVLLASYAAWGERCVERLNGMFAFAVWDEGKGALFLARDRMGQKPLYVAYREREGWARDFNYHSPPGPPQVVGFASELGAIKEMPGFDAAVEIGAVGDYLRWGFMLPSETVYRGARFLRPAHRATVGRDGCKLEQYFWTDGDRPPLPDDAARRGTRERVVEAVRKQLVADVPVGCFLSGGVDSSVVAAAMKGGCAPGQRVLTFSIGFPDPRYDETAYAEQIARHLGTEHRSFLVRPNAAEDLPKLARTFGEPFGDSSALPTHYLARETRVHVKVALSGDGGDELFAGYDRYRAIALSRRVRKVIGAGGAQVAGSMTRILPGVHPKSRLTRVKRLVSSLKLAEDKRYASYLRLFDDAWIAALVREDRRAAVGDNDAFAAVFGALAHKVHPVRAAMTTDELLYLPGDLLTKVDRCSMLHALEVRSPFMDHELVEFAATLTTPQLLKGGPKRMLREAFAADLPAWVFKRKKMGFAVPIGEWFRGELRPMLRDHLFAADSFATGHFNKAVVERLVDEHERERVDHSQRLYALLMLELWWRNQ